MTKPKSLRPAIYTGLALSAVLTVGSTAAINNLEHSESEIAALGNCGVAALSASGAMAAYATKKIKR